MMTSWLFLVIAIILGVSIFTLHWTAQRVASASIFVIAACWFVDVVAAAVAKFFAFRISEKSRVDGAQRFAVNRSRIIAVFSLEILFQSVIHRVDSDFTLIVASSGIDSCFFIKK